MKLGIIGKPQCGKTTIFNAAAGRQESVGDFSNAIHRAIIKVPDERVLKLAELVNPKKITFAEIEFLDAPGLTGKGKASQATEINPEVRMMEALILVIDAYSDDATPEADLGALTDELLLADQILTEGIIRKKTRRAELTGDKSEADQAALLKRCLGAFENGRPLIGEGYNDDELKTLSNYQFLTLKPILVIINISEDKLDEIESIYEKFAPQGRPGQLEFAVLSGKVEMEIVALEEDERVEFLTELGIGTPAVELVIQKSYTLLGLISFLTVGEPEARAWTIRRGLNARKAAGAIHSDIERGFIRAEVASYEDYIIHKTLPALKAAGKSRLEGKEYIVQDGDVILFRFAV